MKKFNCELMCLYCPPNIFLIVKRIGQTKIDYDKSRKVKNRSFTVNFNQKFSKNNCIFFFTAATANCDESCAVNPYGKIHGEKY